MKRTIITLILSALLIFIMPLQVFAAPMPAPATSDQPIERIKPGEGETFRVGGDAIAFKTLNTDAPGELSVIEITAAPQSGSALHKHPPEVFYIVDGFEFYGANPQDTIKATAGDFIHISSGAPHAYKNIGITPGRYVLITAMAGNPEQLWFQKLEYEMSQKLGTPVGDGAPVQAASTKLSRSGITTW